MSTRSLMAILLMTALPAFACGGAETEQEAQEEQMGQTGEMAETEAASEPTMSTGAATLQLAALNNSGITGTASVSHTADSVTVTVNVRGLTEGETYAAHIHRGSCEQQGPVVAPLSSIEAEAGGSGSATTTLALDQLTSGEGEAMGEGEAAQEGEGMQEGQAHEANYYVQVHSPDGTPAACGAVQMEQMGHEM